MGEALFRMASLLLEGGDETPGFWRELGAAVLSPPTGFNRLVFGNRFDAVFPSRNPEVFIRLRLGATVTTNVNNAYLSNDVKKQEGRADYYITYGLPGKPGYPYTRPFDYFQFELTLVPNASDVANAIENVAIKGLLVGGEVQSFASAFSAMVKRRVDAVAIQVAEECLFPEVEITCDKDERSCAVW